MMEPNETDAMSLALSAGQSPPQPAVAAPRRLGDPQFSESQLPEAEYPRGHGKPP